MCTSPAVRTGRCRNRASRRPHWLLCCPTQANWCRWRRAGQVDVAQVGRAGREARTRHIDRAAPPLGRTLVAGRREIGDFFACQRGAGRHVVDGFGHLAVREEGFVEIEDVIDNDVGQASRIGAQRRMLSANEASPAKAVAKHWSAWGATSCTICIMPRPSSVLAARRPRCRGPVSAYAIAAGDVVGGADGGETDRRGVVGVGQHADGDAGAIVAAGVGEVRTHHLVPCEAPRRRCAAGVMRHFHQPQCRCSPPAVRIWSSGT